MGCDIHCYIEYKDKNSSYWHDFGGRINPGRFYSIFASLAGVRNSGDIVPIAKPRGIPDDVSYEAEWDRWVYISKVDGDNRCPPESAERWVKEGCSIYKNDEKKFVSNPDHHSHSWVTPDEFESAINGNQYAVEYTAMLAAMRSLEASGMTVRLVFWFDN